MPLQVFHRKKTIMTTNNPIIDMAADGGTLGQMLSLNATGAKPTPAPHTSGWDDATDLKPSGGSVVDGSKGRRNRFGLLRNTWRTGTWNVRSMYDAKLDTVTAEMKRLDIDVLGISELRWKEKGHFSAPGGYKIFYSGSVDSKRNGVAVICSNRAAKCVLGYKPINDRIITIRFAAKPINVVIVQVYTPITAASEEEIDNFYEQLQETIDSTSKNDMLIMMGDLNAKVGAGHTSEVFGNFGLGERNDAGLRLVDFCLANDLVITNTLFQHHPHRLYTWTSPNGITKNQIDYICIQNRWRSTCKNTKTFPGADCGTDHQLLVAQSS